MGKDGILDGRMSAVIPGVRAWISFIAKLPNMHDLSRFAPPSLLAALLLTACPGDPDTNSPPLDVPPGTTTVGPMATGTGGSTGDTDGSSSGMVTTGADSTSTGGPVVTCEELQCSGFGTCQVGNDGNAFCACDEGYVISEDDPSSCVVDETCVRVRFLEDRCRQIFNGPPAVSLFFGVDFCAGTAVTPDKIAELGLQFVVLENGNDITDNVESFSTIIPTSVESYVTLVIDVSDSVTQSKDLPALVAEMRTLVTALQPAAGDPDVYLSVYVFGRFVEEYVPFTRDFAAVDAALEQVELDPNSVVSLVSGDGTALHSAVELGINRTQRIRELRDAVSWGGVLTTGTVVVITDGQDSSGNTLNSTLINNTLNQVISIGISSAVDDADLEAIGRDGSFLAPTPEDWGVAFSEVANRVDQYPDRAYLLAYCSSTTDGQPNVEVSLGSQNRLIVDETAVCQFNANTFSSNPADVCNDQLFATECDFRTCGGLTACGACADTDCCNGDTCIPPVTSEDAGLDCDGFDDLCNATGEICSGASCEPPTMLGGDCGIGCRPGEGWCDDTGKAPTCVATFAEGTTCDDTTPYQCGSLNCQPTNPDNPFELPTCQSPALMFDRCESQSVVCEDGAYCQGNACAPKKFNAETCGNAQQCRSGQCAQPVQQNICVDSNACFWAWDEKIPN